MNLAIGSKAEYLTYDIVLYMRTWMNSEKIKEEGAAIFLQ